MTTGSVAKMVKEYLSRVSRQRPATEEDETVRQLLLSMGDTPAEVVATLVAEHCQGPWMNDCFCPVAQYLAKKTGHAASATSHVCVVGRFTYAEDGVIDTFVGTEWAKTPPVVADVIQDIDHGMYPELVDRERTRYRSDGSG